MKKDKIVISLTEFMHFISTSGSAKLTVVKTAKKNRDEEFETYKDYWKPFRDALVVMHKKGKSKDVLDDLLNHIPSDKRENYKCAIDGYKKFIGKKKTEWVNVFKKSWVFEDLSVTLNPELGLVINDKVYVIKLFFNAKEALNKRQADLILTLLEKELRAKVGGDEVIFAVLDVRRGKLFEMTDKDLKLYPLLQGEAKSFETQWKNIE